VLGRWLRLHHAARAARAPARRNGVLVIGGPGHQLDARVRAWLRETARMALYQRAHDHAAEVGRRVSGVRIGDPRSRWGSCSPGGVLSFSWRLVLAPPHVLDYVVAHEAAHLRYMSHGPRFWALVRRLDPDFESAREWLARDGAQLHRYG